SRGEQRCGIHKRAGLAVSALRYIQLQPRFLQRVRPVRGESFNGSHFLVADRRNLRLACANRSSIELHRACAASADAATEFRSLHIENVSEYPEEGHFRGHIYCLRLPVNFQCVGHNFNLLEKGFNSRSNSLADLGAYHLWRYLGNDSVRFLWRPFSNGTCSMDHVPFEATPISRPPHRCHEPAL